MNADIRSRVRADAETKVRAGLLMAEIAKAKTIVSLVLPLILLFFLVRSLPGFKLEELPGLILQANPLLLLAAFAIFYIGFPLRGLRWSVLIRGTGFPLRIRDATEIIFLSWLVNCLVPAKLGDVYRAYLLKINSPVSLSRTFGTVFIERVLDRPVNCSVIEYPDSYPSDEPMRRCPDIRKAQLQLKYRPGVSLEEGLRRFLSWTDRVYTGVV